MLSSNVFSRGLNKDYHPKHQPEGTYSFALNAVLETKEGELATLSSEISNKLCSSLPTGKSLHGHVLTNNNDIIVLVYDPEGNHELGIFNSDSCTYTTLLIIPCLNVDPNYPSSMLFRIRNGCERVVYIRASNFPYSVINLEQLSKISEDGIVSDCNLIRLQKEYALPCISLLQGEGDLGIKESAGQIQDGVYYFAFRYLDFEQNPTNWILTTRPIAIADEQLSYTTSAETVNLYDGGSNNPDSPFYVLPSNKSISLLISRLLPDTFKFYQLAVVKRTGDAGEIAGVDILFPRPLQATSDTFVYTGLASQVQSETTLEDILSVILPVDKVEAHAQLDNMHFIANTSTDKYDWSTFQRYASKIKTRWIKDPSESPVDAFVKQGNYYLQMGSFMEDEVYALCAIYEMDNGLMSPPFPIPGRAPDIVTGSNPIIGTNGIADDGDAWDTGTTTSYGTGTPASKTKRWQLISTATKQATNTLIGLMGYHEAATATYPDLPTCDGESYWGQDWQGNDIIPGVTKIRHHRMPGADLFAPVYANASTHQLGILFSNVELPPNVVRVWFGYGDRTFERTILAKGALIPLYTQLERDYFAGEIDTPWDFIFDSNDDLIFGPQVIRPTKVPIVSSPTENVRTFAFICSETLLKDKTFAPSYIRVEKFLQDTEFPIGLGNNQDSGSVTVTEYDTTLNIDTDLWHFRKPSYPTEQWNYDIEFIGKAEKAIYGNKFGNILTNTVDKTVHNQSFNISPIIITLGSQIAEWITAGYSPEDTIPYVSLKIDGDPFSNLYNIKYKRMANCGFTPTSLNSISTNYGGDTFISRVNVTDYRYKQSDADGKQIAAYHLAFPTQDTLINFEFRHGATDPKYSYFQWNHDYAPEGHKKLKRHMATKYYEVTDDIMELYPQSFAYNDSYSYTQSIEDYIPLPFNYEFCNSCSENFPFRIYYSERDDNESQQDMYRIFRPNNYRDLDGSTGSITDLFVNFEQLYARTTDSIFFLPTRPQTISTDITEAYLGTGEALSLPPRQLKTTDFAFGGGNYFKSRILTEYGTIYVDDVSGRVFLLTNQLNDLSNQGLRNFWQNEGVMFFNKQFKKLTGVDFAFKSTQSINGTGYISTYDPRFKRVIIHKKDFRLLPWLESKFHYEDAVADNPADYTTLDKIWFNNFNFYYNDTVGNQILLSPYKSSFFENKSFTVSYSFLHSCWASFHSYLPDYLLHDQNILFSSNGNQIFSHNKDNFLEYYGVSYPMIVDFFAQQDPLRSNISSNLFYTSTLPASRLIAYNSDQSTGELEVLPQTDVFNLYPNNNQIYTKLVDNYYRLNGLRNFATSSTVWSSDWTDIQSIPFNYIDRVPVNIDYSISDYELARLTDHYLGVRMFFDTNEKVNLDIVATQNINRNR